MSEQPESPETLDLSQVMRARREKLERLRELGIEPFAYRYERSHTCAEAEAAFQEAEDTGGLDEDGHGPTVRLAGRLMSWRSHGKSAFADLEDGLGRIQVYFRKNAVGDEAWDLLDLTDLGDWVGVEGHVARTRMGQITVFCSSWTLLSKALRPLPIGKVEVDPESGERTVHSGFADMEGRYRQRYADLAVHPEVREVFRLRARVITRLRQFLDERGFLEVETPALQPLYGGALARPFITHHNALDMRLYLRIADELYLKRLIVGGMDRVYEIAKDFRNEGIDRFHNPEFTMLEFYEAFADYHDMMDLIETMLVDVVGAVRGEPRLHFQGHEIEVEAPFARVSLVESLAEAMGTDPLALSDGELMDRARALEIAGLEGAGRGKLLDKLFSELVQPKLIQPTFVVDYPRELSPLAKAHREKPGMTERFELFMAGEEIANAFSELNDPLDQRDRFEDQAKLRAAGDEEALQVDEDYLRSMEYGMPPIGGLGMGVDRLVMLIADAPSIRDVILFPTLRPE
jgi:lysyl-tRNA synthetase class 2